jgi:VWFA-related protein
MTAGAAMLAFCITTLAAGQTTQTAQPAQTEGAVFRVTTSLVQIDAVVTDRKGRQVTDLSPADFEILADGRPQAITHFSYVRIAPDTPADSGPTASGSLGVPAAPLRPEDVRRTIVLLADDLGLSWESTAYLRRALGRFIDRQMQAGDVVAVVRSGGGAGAFQQFTADPRVLHAEVDQIRWNLNGRRGLDAVPPVDLSPGAFEKGAVPIDPRSATQFLADNDLYTASLYVGTLGALNTTINALRGMPGRKSVVLFSDGLSLFLTPGDYSAGLEADAFLIGAMHKLVDNANRAGTVIYTMDARGLQPLYPDAKDNLAPPSPFSATPPSTLAQATMSARLTAVHADQAGLEFLSKQTGGLFYQGNDMNDGLARFLDDQKGYYLLGYKPGDRDFAEVNGERPYHKLVVKLTRPGLEVRSRTGFIGATDDEVNPGRARVLDQLHAAMLSPFAASGIRLRLTPQYRLDPKNGPVVHNLVYVDAHDLTFAEQAGGGFKATVDVLAGATSATGETFNVSRLVDIPVDWDRMDRVLREGVLISIDAQLGKGGPYQAQAAVRDRASGKIGSASQFVEIPDVKKKGMALNSIAMDNGAEPIERAFTGTAPARRMFRRGSQVVYACLAANTRAAGMGTSVAAEVRLIHDGKVVYSGKPTVAALEGQSGFALTGRLQLAAGIEPGEYYLQLVARQTHVGKRDITAVQSVDFEVTP